MGMPRVKLPRVETSPPPTLFKWRVERVRNALREDMRHLLERAVKSPEDVPYLRLSMWETMICWVALHAPSAQAGMEWLGVTPEEFIHLMDTYGGTPLLPGEQVGELRRKVEALAAQSASEPVAKKEVVKRNKYEFVGPRLPSWRKDELRRELVREFMNRRKYGLRDYPTIRFRARCAGPFNDLHVQVDGVDVVFRFSSSGSKIEPVRLWGKTYFIVYVSDRHSADDHTPKAYLEFFCDLTLEQVFNILEKAMHHI